jgi:hypothetical protein
MQQLVDSYIIAPRDIGSSTGGAKDVSLSMSSDTAMNMQSLAAFSPFLCPAESGPAFRNRWSGLCGDYGSFSMLENALDAHPHDNKALAGAAPSALPARSRGLMLSSKDSMGGSGVTGVVLGGRGVEIASSAASISAVRPGST